MSIQKSISAFVNEVLLPFKLLIPQPIIALIPGLTTNKEIRINAVLEHITAGMKLLDIGCGDNALVKEHRSKGGEGLGVDVYSWDGVDEVVADSSRLSFESGSFDCVTIVAALNHIPNRENTLMEVHRVLKKNGQLVITLLNPTVSRYGISLPFGTGIRPSEE